ncbi:MAG: hypothetical protein J3Q66DRAFT_149150 [Benniella sp.]|nr:MAG: hypothetical protein J3Q66DRAFT_149150 [Benniella sp.]
MKSPLKFATSLTPFLVLALACFTAQSAQGGNIISHILRPRNDPNNDLPNTHPPNMHPPTITTASRLEWNSQIGHRPSFQQSRQGGDRGQFQPYANFALQEEHHAHQQVQFGTMPPGPAAAAGGNGPPCRSRNRVYLPDMQSFLIQTPLTYQEAVQACIACGSELVLIDGTNLERFREAFTSLGGLYGDQHFWIKSWFGEEVDHQGACPAVLVNPLMGNRLEPVQDDCQTRFYALCY